MGWPIHRVGRNGPWIWPPAWGAAGPDIVRVLDVGSMQRGDVKDALAAAGIRAWAFLPLIRPGRVRGRLDFDTMKASKVKDFPQPVMRLAGDAVANAIAGSFSSMSGRGSRRGWSGRAACR